MVKLPSTRPHTLKSLLVLELRLERKEDNDHDIFKIYINHKFYSRHTLYKWVMWHCLAYILQMLRNGTILKAKSSSLFHFLVLRVFDKVFKGKHIVQSYSSNSSLNHSMVYESLPRHNMKLPCFCFILHLLGLCGAQVGINMIAYLHCIYCKVKTRIQGENVINLDQDV